MIGRLTPKRVQRAIDNPCEVELWCLDFAGVVEKDEAGRPVRFRRRCKNRQCCQPGPGTIALHVWDLATGEYETVVLPDPRGEGRLESVPLTAGRASRQGVNGHGPVQRR